MEKYYKNFILCGEADYYCLICREAFIMIEEVDKHLRWQNHRKDVKHQEYVTKFRDDKIYKIVDYFYCEICNLIIKSATEHIKGNIHAVLKTSNNVLQKSSIIERTSDGAIRINNITITSHQWHSIVDDKCLLCNETVVNSLSHFTSFSHIIKLIQSETLHKHNHYYRKIGKGKYYCFTCYKVFETSLDTHVSNHKDIKILEKEPKNHHIKKSDDTNNNNSAIMAILKDNNEEHFNFNKKNNIATCKICQELAEVDFHPISQHRAIHDTSNYIYVDSGKRRKELKIYGNKNYIKLNEGGGKGYCSLCNMYMSGHVNVFKQHVEGAIHRGHLELKGLIKDRKHEKPSEKGVPYHRLFKSIVGPICIDELSFIVINDEICLEEFSFQLINFIEDFNGIIRKCLVCDITLNCDDVMKHAKCKEHMNSFDNIMIIPTEKGEYREFIRQIRPDLYHCGCCNKVFPFWKNIKRHLKSQTHQIQRTKKTLLNNICVFKYLNPFIDLENLEAYVTLRRLDEFY